MIVLVTLFFIAPKIIHQNKVMIEEYLNTVCTTDYSLKWKALADFRPPPGTIPENFGIFFVSRI